MTFATHIDPQKVRSLLQALEENHQDKAIELIDELTQMREGELYQQVSRLTQNLHQTLDDLDVDSSVLMHTKHDLPDITERLRYVINETQAASEKTLYSAENAISLLEEAETMLSEGQGNEAAGSIKASLEQANQELTSIMLAQSFQDLTGQVLNRVILIITELEASLKTLIERSSHDYEAIPDKIEDKAEEMRGIGPNVTAKSKVDAVDSQDDVDDLLDNLGI